LDKINMHYQGFSCKIVGKAKIFRSQRMKVVIDER